MSLAPKMLPSFTGIGLLMIVCAQFVGIAACFGIFLQQLWNDKQLTKPSKAYTICCAHFRNWSQSSSLIILVLCLGSRKRHSVTQMTLSRPSLANKVQSADKFAAALSRADKADKRCETRICIHHKLWPRWQNLGTADRSWRWMVAVGQVSSGELCICPSPLWLPGHCLLCPLTGHSPLPERRIYHRHPMAPPACNVYTPGFGIPDLTFPSFYSPMLSLFHWAIRQTELPFRPQHLNRASAPIVEARIGRWLSLEQSCWRTLKGESEPGSNHLPSTSLCKGSIGDRN